MTQNSETQEKYVWPYNDFVQYIYFAKLILLIELGYSPHVHTKWQQEAWSNSTIIRQNIIIKIGEVPKEHLESNCKLLFIITENGKLSY